MAFGHDQTIQFLNKFTKNKKSKNIFQRDIRDFGALAAAISTKIPSSAMPVTDHMVVV